MIDTDCQLDKIYNYLEDTTLGVSMREFLD